ncbi:unnamed protein product [Symbiodinium microadriaticum]|nr:unnamed protein product [Symbiodinium microadriaticum]
MRRSNRKSGRFDILYNSRTVVLMYLVTVVGGIWLLEQPGGSCLEFYPCFRDLLSAHWNVSGALAVLGLECTRT